MSNTKESVVLKYDDMGIPSIMLKVENTAKTPEEATECSSCVVLSMTPYILAAS